MSDLIGQSATVDDPHLDESLVSSVYQSLGASRYGFEAERAEPTGGSLKLAPAGFKSAVTPLFLLQRER